MDRTNESLLPEAFQKNFQGKVNAASLKHSRTPDGRYLHTYSVSWSGQRRVVETSSGRTSSNEGFWGFFKKLLPTGAAPSRTPPLTRCDGPCNEMKPFSEMTTIGLCEHSVCHQCLDSSPNIPLSEHGTGCPNKKCYEEDKIVQNRLKQLGMLPVRNPDSNDAYKKTCPVSKSRCDDNECAKPAICKKKSANGRELTCPVTKSRCVEKECKTREDCKKSKTAFKDVMLYGDENTARSVAEPETENEGQPRRMQYTLIKSETLEAPLRQYIMQDTESSQMRTIHLKVAGRTPKWFCDEVPADWEFIEALKTILRNHKIETSSTGLNFLSRMPNRHADEKQWTKLHEKELTAPVKKVTAAEDIYLVLNAPSY